MEKPPTIDGRTTKPINYAVGMFGTSIPINMFRTFALVFFVHYLSAITAEQFALILLVYFVVDAIDNPVYGFLSDSTRTRWGRRRPYLVIGAPLLALSFIAFFNVPGWMAEGSLFWYALIIYCLTGTLDALVNVNYGSLFPELFRTQEARAKTNAMRQAFQFVAMIISIALTPIIVEQIGYSLTSIIYACLAVTVILYMAFNTYETQEAQKRPKPDLVKTILQIARTPKFWLYGLANAAFFASLSILQQSAPLYTWYTLGAGGEITAVLLGSVILCAIIGIPLWHRVLGKLRLVTVWRTTMAVIAFSLIPLFFAGSVATAIVPMIILGLGYGGASLTIDLVGARIMDEDLARYGVQREGTFISLSGVLNRTSNLFVALGIFMVSRIFGYVSGDEPGLRPDEAWRFAISVYPFIIMVVAIGFAFLVNFKKPVERENA